MTRLWIVEDEEALGKYLQQNLSDAQFRAELLTTLDQLQAIFTTPEDQLPAVLVLDRLLDGKDSSDLIPRLKERFPQLRILVLSAIGGPLEKSRLLDLGADDYMSKPFSIEEVISRIRVLLRRPQEDAVPMLRLGNLSLNPVSQICEVEGRRVDLSRKEFQLVTLLMQNPSRVFSRVELLERVWDIKNDVESNVVEVTIKNVRKKLEAAEASVKILSKRFLGYWIEA